MWERHDSIYGMSVFFNQHTRSLEYFIINLHLNSIFASLLVQDHDPYSVHNV